MVYLSVPFCPACTRGRDSSACTHSGACACTCRQNMHMHMQAHTRACTRTCVVPSRTFRTTLRLPNTSPSTHAPSHTPGATTAGWQYVGELCRDPHCRMLECPLLIPIPELLPRAAAPAGGCGCGRGCGEGGAGGAAGAAGAGASGERGQQHLFCYSADYCANGEPGVCHHLSGTNARGLVAGMRGG